MWALFALSTKFSRAPDLWYNSRMKEVDYYPELAKRLRELFAANFANEDINIEVMFLPEFGSQLREYLTNYIARNNGNVSEALKTFARGVPKLRTDMVILADNPETNKCAMVIVEVKLLNSAGLSELSQLIGYNLVSKVKYGILVNVGGGISPELQDILLADADVTEIERKISVPPYTQQHKIGVMSYIPSTGNLEYIETLSGVSIPSLASEIEQELS